MKISTLEEGAGRYRTVYMDPPWSYQDSTARGAAAHHYPTMTPEDLAALPVPQLAHPDGAHVWIWTTMPKIRDRVPHDLIDAWGLRWVGEIVWDKRRIGPGRWLRSQVEVLVLAVAGRHPPKLLSRAQANVLALEPDPEISARWALEEVPEVLSILRTPKHSEKPQQFRDLVARLSPAPRIELFARTAPLGWDVWGLEAPAATASDPLL